MHFPLFFFVFFFSLRKKSCRNITYDEFKTALAELARKKYKEKSGEEAEAEIFKLVEGKSPIIAGVTVRRMNVARLIPPLASICSVFQKLQMSSQRAVASPTVSRLTDTTKFTGSHKERFDSTGRGKGKAGREDIVDTSGYVSGYKHRGTYEKKVTKQPVGKPM